MATIRTIYEVSKPVEQFYSVERAGYIDLSSATFQVVNDMLQLGAFTVANVNFKSTQNGALLGGLWPVTERVYTVNNGGSGYKTGDRLVAIGGTLAENGTPFTFTVDTIKTQKKDGVTVNGVINTITINDAGSYSVVPGPMANVAVAYESDTATTGSIEFRGNVTNSVGASVNSLGPLSSVTSTWPTLYGNNGSGGTLGTRWPQTGIWCFVSARPATVVAGALVTLSDTVAASSVIPEGTYIKSITPVIGEIPIGSFYNFSIGRYVERTEAALWFEFSQPVTISRGDILNFKGFEATLNNLQTAIPNQWQVTLEAGGAVDPLNDNIGVFGNVVAAVTQGNIIQITDIVTPNNYNPVIYAGHTVTQPPVSIGNPLPPNILVKSIENYSEFVGNTKVFKANVTLNTNVTVPEGKQLQFVFSNPQPWRIAFQVQENLTRPGSAPQILNVYAATEVQLPNSGKLSKVFESSGTHADWAGLMGNKWTSPTSARPTASKADEGFYNREIRVSDSANNYPLNYCLTLTNRGIFLGMWEGNWSTLQKSAVDQSKDNYFNWFLIQRPVNRVTGRVVTTGRCPVFCINGVGFKYWKFIVREEDVLHPTTGPSNSQYQTANSLTDAITTTSTPYRVPADYHTIDSFAILNTSNQISLTEDSKYLLSFLTNLTTPRFRYPDELDMLGQTSADVVGQGVEIPITPYGQTLPSTYLALPANNKYNTGMRICVIKDIPTEE
jgi:hypothetical protein